MSLGEHVIVNLQTNTNYYIEPEDLETARFATEGNSQFDVKCTFNNSWDAQAAGSDRGPSENSPSDRV